MKKILCINVSDCGSTGKIIEEIAKYNQQYRFILCVPAITRKMDFVHSYQLMTIPHEQGIYRRVSKILGFPYGFAPFSTARLINIIKQEKPDLVHVHCMNVNMVNIYKLFRVIAKKNIPTVVTNHAEFYYTGSCAYSKECMQWVEGCKRCRDLKYAADTWFDCTSLAWKRMKKALQAISKLDIVSVSPWVLGRCKKSGIMKELSQKMILNGIDVEKFSPRNTKELRQDLKLGEKKVVLHVTASFSDDVKDIKGGRFILNLARKKQNSSECIFVVAGNVDKNIYKTEVPNNLLLLGNINDQEMLAQLYSLADLTVIVSKRETFSMVVAESLCCGTPVIGFSAGGPESIAIEKYTEFVKYGNEIELEKTFDKWLTVKTPIIAKNCATCAIKKYDSVIMAKKYAMLYDKLL